MAEIIAKLFPFEKLGRRAAVIMPAYLFCLGGLAAVALVVMFAESSNSPGADDPGCDIDEGCEENQLASFGNCLWFVFVTFHTCAYGDLIPTTTMGKSVAMLCSGSGYVFLVTICLAAFISTTQPSGTHPDVLRAAVHKALKQVIPSYLVTIALVLIFFGIFFDAADCVEEYGPDDQIVEDIGTFEAMFFSWNTFHHASYGDRFPTTTLGKAVAAFVMLIGYMFVPYALAVGLADAPEGNLMYQGQQYAEAPLPPAVAPAAENSDSIYG